MNAVGTPELTNTYDESTMKSESAASTETENADVFADAGIEMLLLALAAKGDLRERDGNVAAAVDALGAGKEKRVKKPTKRSIAALADDDDADAALSGMRCAWCGRTDTPQWRRCRDGSNAVLCNSCGLKSARKQRKNCADQLDPHPRAASRSATAAAAAAAAAAANPNSTATAVVPAASLYLGPLGAAPFKPSTASAASLLVPLIPQSHRAIPQLVAPVQPVAQAAPQQQPPKALPAFLNLLLHTSHADGVATQ